MSKDKYNGMRRARDWEGKKIVTLRDLTNGLGLYPAGSKGVVECVSRGSLSLQLDACECCHAKPYITRVSYFDVRLAEELFSQPSPQAKNMRGFPAGTSEGKMFLSDVANTVCKHIPEGCHIQLCMENGSAYVELFDQGGNPWKLPDSADKTLEEQINDALCVANGWSA
jgi:hypothetical protein